jgi:hypothetical protein
VTVRLAAEDENVPFPKALFTFFTYGKLEDGVSPEVEWLPYS